MLYWLASFFQTHVNHSFRLFEYITLRCVLAALTALFLSLFFGPILIKRLANLQIGQVVRDDGPQTHLKKTGTPTMGGVLILMSVIIATLLWVDLGNRLSWVVVLVTTAFGVIGYVDDYRKVVYKNSKGLSARWKMFWQVIVSLLAATVLFLAVKAPAETQLFLPFFKNIALPLGGFFIVWVVLVIVGSSNAVNLTDGLDGLAIMPVVLVAMAFILLAYLAGNSIFSNYLHIAYIPGAGELAVIGIKVKGL